VDPHSGYCNAGSGAGDAYRITGVRLTVAGVPVPPPPPSPVSLCHSPPPLSFHHRVCLRHGQTAHRQRFGRDRHRTADCAGQRIIALPHCHPISRRLFEGCNCARPERGRADRAAGTRGCCSRGSICQSIHHGIVGRGGLVDAVLATEVKELSGVAKVYRCSRGRCRQSQFGRLRRCCRGACCCAGTAAAGCFWSDPVGWQSKLRYIP